MSGYKEFFDKETAINHLWYAVKPECPDITGLEYNREKDAVLIKYRNGSLWVNTAGGSCIEMLAGVIRQIKKHFLGGYKWQD